MNDDKLREAFDAMRTEDARVAPSLERVLGRTTQPAVMTPRWTVLATAGALAAVLVAVLTSRARRHDLVVPQEIIALTTWTAPTDVLLEGARMHLVTQAPSLGASIVDTLRGTIQ